MVSKDLPLAQQQAATPSFLPLKEDIAFYSPQSNVESLYISFPNIPGTAHTSGFTPAFPTVLACPLLSTAPIHILNSSYQISTQQTKIKPRNNQKHMPFRLMSHIQQTFMGILVYIHSHQFPSYEKNT